MFPKKTKVFESRKLEVDANRSACGLSLVTAFNIVFSRVFHETVPVTGGGSVPGRSFVGRSEKYNRKSGSK